MPRGPRGPQLCAAAFPRSDLCLVQDRPGEGSCPESTRPGRMLGAGRRGSGLGWGMQAGPGLGGRKRRLRRGSWSSAPAGREGKEMSPLREANQGTPP